MSGGKIVYAGMSADIIHLSQTNIISRTAELGKLTCNTLADSATVICECPLEMTYKLRRSIIVGFKEIERVSPLEQLNCSSNLLKYRSDFIAHGDNLQNDVKKHAQKAVVDTSPSRGGELFEIPCTRGTSSTRLSHATQGIGATPDIQKNKLRSIQEGTKSRYDPGFFSAPGIKEEQVLTSSRETLAQGEVDGDLCSVGIGEHALLAAIFSTAMLS